MIVIWPFYAQVVLSWFFHSGYGCLGTDSLPAPLGYKVMLLSDVRKNFKPNSFVLMTYSDALAQGKLQRANGNKAAKKTNSRALPAQVVARALPAQTGRGESTAADALWTAEAPPPKDRSVVDDDDCERNGRMPYDGGRSRHVLVDGDRHDDVWREDVTVAAVVVDPGRRVRMFAITDDGDCDGSVAAVDACVVDPETGAVDDVETAADDPSASAEDDVLAMAALYFPVVDELAKQIVPGIRRQQVLSLALNAARATSDAVERLAVATRDGKATRMPVASTRNLLNKPVNYDYASSRIYDAWENIFRYDDQYIPSSSNPIHPNSISIQQQTDYEGKMYENNNLYENNSVVEDEFNEYVENDNDVIDDNEDSDDDDFDDDVDHNGDSDDDIDDDGDIDYNDEISYEVHKIDHREVCVDNMSSDNGNPEASKLDKIVQFKKISNEIRSIQPNFIEDMSGKRLLQYVNELNIKQQGPMVENQKVCIKLMKFDENVSEKDIQQLITTITNVSNLLIASVLDQYKANSY